jgi:uncharacterized protein with PIN domain
VRIPFRNRATKQIKGIQSLPKSENQVYQTVQQVYNRCPNPSCSKLFLEFAKETDYTTFPRTEFQVCPYCKTRVVTIQGRNSTPVPQPLTIVPTPLINWEKHGDFYKCLDCGSVFKEPRMFQFGGGDGHSVPKSYYCPNCNKSLKDWGKN